MNSLYSFIENGLEKFSNTDGKYTNDIKQCCKELNCILNNPNSEDYEDYIGKRKEEIDNKIKSLFYLFRNDLYLSLERIFNLISIYQNDAELSGDNYRDHYLHSIQSFLLAISLYPFLIDTFHIKLEKNVIPKIFTIFMYHDLGYLYKVKETSKRNITKTLHRLFCNFHESDLNVQDIKQMLCLTDIKDESIITITNSNDISDIWKDSPNGVDKSALLSELNITSLSPDCYKHHSYESAILLHRLIKTKQLFYSNLSNDLFNTINISSKTDTEYDNFLEIIKVILCHDFCINPKINFKNDFWCAFLMIVDELQEYGRLYQDEQSNHKVINPKHVLINIDTGKILISNDFPSTLSMNQKNFYDAYCEDSIYDKLIRKIDVIDLNILFERNLNT